MPPVRLSAGYFHNLTRAGVTPRGLVWGQSGWQSYFHIAEVVVVESWLQLRNSSLYLQQLNTAPGPPLVGVASRGVVGLGLRCGKGMS